MRAQSHTPAEPMKTGRSRGTQMRYSMAVAKSKSCQIDVQMKVDMDFGAVTMDLIHF